MPLGIGHIRTRTHDYKRHGTITLFAALNYLDGKLISRTEQRHTHVEWLRFLKQIERETPKSLAIHLIVDNYSTHKHERVRRWVDRHPRIHYHFTPTGSSWLNLVERFFADLTSDVIRDGSFRSVRAGFLSAICSASVNPGSPGLVYGSAPNPASGASIPRPSRAAKRISSGRDGSGVG